MSWSQPPFNPGYSQPRPSGPPGGHGPYNPGYSQASPAQSFHPGPPTSLPPGGQFHQPYQHAPPPTYSLQGVAPGPGTSGGYPPPPVTSQATFGGPYPPPGVSSELWSWFQSVDADHSGKITALELRQALVNTNWTHFNAETCRLLIGMFDQNKDGAIDVYEFSALWQYIQDWRKCFDSFDKDKSGNIDAGELQQALHTFGYQLSLEFCRLCTRVFDRSDQNSMNFDDFIQCCVMLRSLTEGFKRLDTQRSGTITISYEQFLELAIDH